MKSYIIFDLETSGLNSKHAEIIEISAIKVESNNVIGEFNTLVKPSNLIDPSSTAVNGITNDMVSASPTLQDILPQFIEFIGSSILLGYNISSFDLPILRRSAAEILNFDIQNDYLDILYMARDRLPFLPNCKLSTVAAYFNICTNGAHRALTDCYITKSCYEKLLPLDPCEKMHRSIMPRKHHGTTYTDQTKALQTLQGFLLGVIADDVLAESEVHSLKKWLDDNSDLAGNYPFDRVYAVIKKSLEDGVLEQLELEEMLMLFKKFSSPTQECACACENLSFSEKTVCLTGDFEYASRKEIEKLVVRAGATCKSAVSGKTDFVIIGNLGSPDWSCGNYGTKVKRAMELQEQGKNIQLMKENEFISILKNQGVIS